MFTIAHCAERFIVTPCKQFTSFNEVFSLSKTEARTLNSFVVNDFGAGSTRVVIVDFSTADNTACGEDRAQLEAARPLLQKNRNCCPFFVRTI